MRDFDAYIARCYSLFLKETDHATLEETQESCACSKMIAHDDDNRHSTHTNL